jgi:plasmid stabilization system protein ParE
MVRTAKIEVISSEKYTEDLQKIVQYGIQTFGFQRAFHFHENIQNIVNSLGNNYLMFPECRFLTTKSKMYRNIIFDSYLIIYRVTRGRIEVLRALHSSLCTSKRIRDIRRMKL